MHDYWKGFGKKIILLTGTPRFPRHQDYVLAGAVPRIDLQREELALTEEVQRFLADNDVAVVDRNVIFCSINDCSYYSPDGAVLIADARGEHLTMEGARLFGRALLDSDTEIGRWNRSRTQR
jgi:SGNH domain (fused to AT3 domains)